MDLSHIPLVFDGGFTPLNTILPRYVIPTLKECLYESTRTMSEPVLCQSGRQELDAICGYPNGLYCNDLSICIYYTKHQAM
jgi:hypothetical protein